MWLLDANMDIHLLDFFSELGIPCESAIHRGWRQLANGQLITAAAEAGFSCILTKDRLFAESAGRSLINAPKISIIVMRLPQMSWKKYIGRFRAEWEKGPITPVSGAIIYWPQD
jgi:predicted nuclease of predicted toxin-antitoxin system